MAASGRVREIRAEIHLSKFGITVSGEVKFDREKMVNHARMTPSLVICWTRHVRELWVLCLNIKQNIMHLFRDWSSK